MKTFLAIVLLIAMTLAACHPMPSFVAATPAAFTPIPHEAQRPPGEHHGALNLEGVSRKFITYIPASYRPDQPAPLVINLHGRGGSNTDQIIISQLHAKAEDAGFIVVSPQATGVPATWWPAPGPNGQADLEFFRLLIATLESQHSIDPARIYVTGLSNGGAMANRLACTMSDVIAAIAPVAGAHPQMETCEAALPVAVIIFHGTQDSIIPYVGDGDYLPSVAAWSSAWAQRNQCDLNPETEAPYPSIQSETWSGCAGEATVSLYTVEGGHHAWPVTETMHATDILWEFFVAHPKNLRRDN
jgi:polyhydroxybutyrate depolymerase